MSGWLLILMVFTSAGLGPGANGISIAQIGPFADKAACEVAADAAAHATKAVTRTACVATASQTGG